MPWAEPNSVQSRKSIQMKVGQKENRSRKMKLRITPFASFASFIVHNNATMEHLGR